MIVELTSHTMSEIELILHYIIDADELKRFLQSGIITSPILEEYIIRCTLHSTFDKNQIITDDRTAKTYDINDLHSSKKAFYRLKLRS